MELHQQHREDIEMEETKIGIKLEEETKQIKKMCEKLMDTVNYELDKGIENVDTKELGEAIDMIKDLYEAKKEMFEACYYKQIMEAMEKQDFEDEEEVEKEGRKGYRGQPRSQSGRFMRRGDGRRSNRGRRGYEMPMMMYDDDMDDWEEMERMRDMDRMSYGRMGYSGGSSGGGSSSGMSSGGSQGGQSSGGMSGGSSGGGSQSRGGNTRGYEEGYMAGYSEGTRENQRDGREGRSGEARRGYMESKEMNGGNSPEEKQQKMKELEKYMKELGADITDMISDMSQEEKTLMKQKMQVLMQKI